MAQRPNIVFIVADDLGYADLGCYGGRGFDGTGRHSVSPVLDALAANGLRFTQGYANSPVCSPTRFALMTARWQYRLRGALDEPIRSASKGSATLGLPPQVPTLPSLLKAAGYRTALIGKWHLGYPPHFSPLKSGYEEFFGPMSGGIDYFTHKSTVGQHDLYEGEEETHPEGYLTDLLSERAAGYVRRMGAQQAPFFLSLHYTAPHWPFETRDDAHIAPDVAKNLFHLDGGNIHSYRRMIHHMDEGIGQVANALRDGGLELVDLHHVEAGEACVRPCPGIEQRVAGRRFGGGCFGSRREHRRRHHGAAGRGGERDHRRRLQKCTSVHEKPRRCCWAPERRIGGDPRGFRRLRHMTEA